MTGAQIRQRFLEHFRSRDHLELPSAPLIPHRDPTTLFISAGMQPLKPYFQGVSQPPAPRLTSAQKCFRTVDIAEVGKTDRHCTFFEMLGNFAPTGDYFKEGAIPFAWSLVTEGFAMPKDRLRVTVHPTDDEAAGLWRQETDVRPEWIYRNDENWWAAGDTGPSGPDSEIWWDRGLEYGCGQADCYPDHCDRFLEFWNLVFMQFDRQSDGSLQPLPRPGIDTGMGLERITSILQDVDNVFDTDLFRPLMDFAATARRPDRIAQRVISDHLRAMTFLIADGVTPTNEGRGYVLRRLIRRAALHARRTELPVKLSAGVDVVVSEMSGHYPDLKQPRDYVVGVIDAETERFARTLEQGMEQFERMLARNPRLLPGEDAFLLHDTYGFPLELTHELAHERGVEVDEQGFQDAMARQRERSRTMSGQRWPDAAALPRSEFKGYHATETEARVVGLRRGGEAVERVAEGDQVEVFLDVTPFYGESGGQIGDTGILEAPGGRVRVEDTQKPSDGVYAHLGTVVVGSLEVGDEVVARVDAARRRQVARHHSATHLLHKSLREVLGEQTVQRGSWVGPDHTTFDFPLNRAITEEELAAVSEKVSAAVRAALPFHESYMPYREAVDSGAMHLFEEKYGDTVRVVCFGDWTCELCGGTHVANTADVGTAVIVSESSIGQGLRRIDLVVGEAADALVRRRLGQLSGLGRSLGVPPEQVASRVGSLQQDLRAAQRENRDLREQVQKLEVRTRSKVGVQHTRIPLIVEQAPARTGDELRGFADRFMEILGDEGGAVAVTNGDLFVVKVSNNFTDAFQATELARLLGQGGGRPNLAQGRLTVDWTEARAKLEEALR
ncbi:MAG TPA: alanine--tRNA ligase [Candidatus Dormibacteraeota bacterium]